MLQSLRHLPEPKSVLDEMEEWEKVWILIVLCAIAAIYNFKKLLHQYGEDAPY